MASPNWRKVLHVLQHERRGPVVINDVDQREEEVALFLALEAVLFTEAQFFGDAREAEGLAGKTGPQRVPKSLPKQPAPRLC